MLLLSAVALTSGKSFFLTLGQRRSLNADGRVCEWSGYNALLPTRNKFGGCCFPHVISLNEDISVQTWGRPSIYKVPESPHVCDQPSTLTNTNVSIRILTHSATSGCRKLEVFTNFCRGFVFVEDIPLCYRIWKMIINLFFQSNTTIFYYLILLNNKLILLFNFIK